MRKLLMLAVMVVAALAVAAPSASALNPDFPHPFSSGNDWEAVFAYDGPYDPESEVNCEPPMSCNFDAGNQFTWNGYLDYQNGFGYSLGGCNAAVDGGMNGSGYMWIDVSGTCFTNGSSNISFDDSQPWLGMACLHEPTGEVWVRQQVRLETPSTSYDGNMFGLFDGDSIDYYGSTIELGENVLPVIRNTFGGDEFAFEGEIRIVADPNEESPCAWPELEA